MPHELEGFKDYYKTHDHLSLFNKLLDSKTPYKVHLHGHQTLTARVVENDTYDVTLEADGQAPVLTRKIDIKFAYAPDQAAAIHLKGGIPLTLLRHSICDLRDKSGRCFLKSVQDETRDWQKSVYYVEKAQ